MSEIKNILFVYSYTDGLNNKTSEEIVFANPGDLGLGEIEYKLKSKLVGLEYFDPIDFMVPALFGEYADLDKNPRRHSFERVSYTDKKATDKRSIVEFIENIK